MNVDPHEVLLNNIKNKLKELKEKLKKINSHWLYEDHIYRFYHHSLEVYPLQSITESIVTLLKSLAPDGCSFNKYFEEIFKQGTGKIFEESHYEQWTVIIRPILEAFFHAKYFLEMAVKYGSKLKKAPDLLPSGWAALLYFYNIRKIGYLKYKK